MPTETPKAVDVFARLEKLEQANRWYKQIGFTFGAVGLFAVAIATTGAGAAAQRAAPNEAPQPIKASEFDLVDATGHVRATLKFNNTEPALYFLGDADAKVHCGSGPTESACLNGQQVQAYLDGLRLQLWSTGGGEASIWGGDGPRVLLNGSGESYVDLKSDVGGEAHIAAYESGAGVAGASIALTGGRGAEATIQAAGSGATANVVGSGGATASLNALRIDGTPHADVNVSTAAGGVATVVAEDRIGPSLHMDQCDPNLPNEKCGGNPSLNLELGETPNMRIRDAAGYSAILGSEDLEKKVGGTTSRTSAAFLGLFDMDGTILWSTPH